LVAQPLVFATRLGARAVSPTSTSALQHGRRTADTATDDPRALRFDALPTTPSS